MAGMALRQPGLWLLARQAARQGVRSAARPALARQPRRQLTAACLAKFPAQPASDSQSTADVLKQLEDMLLPRSIVPDALEEVAVNVAAPDHFPSILLTMRAYDYAVLDSYTMYVQRAAKRMDIKCSGRVALPTNKRRWVVIKSPHVSKKHRIHFEMRTHRRRLQLSNLSGKTARVFLEYIESNLPEGVSMRVIQESAEAIDADLLAVPAAAPPAEALDADPVAGSAEPDADSLAGEADRETAEPETASQDPTAADAESLADAEAVSAETPDVAVDLGAVDGPDPLTDQNPGLPDAPTELADAEDKDDKEPLH